MIKYFCGILIMINYTLENVSCQLFLQLSTDLDGAVAACGGGGSALEYLNTFLTPQFFSTDIPATLSRGFINDGSITCWEMLNKIIGDVLYFVTRWETRLMDLRP